MALTHYDRLMMLGLLVTALLCLLYVRHFVKGAKVVVIQVDGEEVISAPLSEDALFVVNGVLGPAKIEVKSGRVRMVDSACNKKICVQTGWIDRAHQTIVCVPNRIVITLIGDKDEIDAITR